MALVGKKAPVFKTTAIVNGGELVQNFSLEQYKGKSYVLFFFYQMDFTSLCPAEILGFQDKLKEFEKLNVKVVGCSVDSHHSHWAWLQTPRARGGIEGVTYPLVADFSKTISMNYGVLAGEYDTDEDGNAVFNGLPQAYRGLFLIDKNGVVRHELINDMPLGRNVDEALRIVKTLQLNEEIDEV